MKKILSHKMKHFSPITKEWDNSIYSYKKQTLKGLHSKKLVLIKLIKSYMSLYSKALDKALENNRSRRYRARTKKLSVANILTNRLELKHTADAVVITVYIYNAIKDTYINASENIKMVNEVEALIKAPLTSTIVDKMEHYVHTNTPYNKPTLELPALYSFLAIAMAKPNVSNMTRKTLTNAIYKLYLTIEALKKYNENFKNTLTEDSKQAFENKAIALYINHYKNYLFTIFKKEYMSIYYKQAIAFNKIRFSKVYVRSLEDQVKKLYNKNIEFNFVALKYLFLDSSLLSSALASKLKRKKNKIYYRAKDVLSMFEIPELNRQKFYDETYNRKLINESPRIEKQLDQTEAIGASITKALPNLTHKFNMSDMQDYSSKLVKVFKTIKYKSVKGIRLEVSGRLTRRYTAARSLHKLRYKGNVKNTSSSVQGIPTAMVRGQNKSNVQYTFLKAKRRIGSFGLKTWVSGI